MTDMDTLIGSATRVEGDVLFRGGLRIDGQVVGNVVAEAGHASHVVIGASARVEGEVRCDHLVVNGEIRGGVRCAALLEIQPKARIFGDVCYKVLEMHGGAQVLGRLTPHDSSDAGPVLVVSGA